MVNSKEKMMATYIRVIVSALLLAALAWATTRVFMRIWAPPIDYIHHGTTEPMHVGESVTCMDVNGCSVVCPSLHMCSFKHQDGDLVYEHEVHGGAGKTGVTEPLKYREVVTVSWLH